MSENGYKRKYEFQQKMIQRQSEQIEFLKSRKIYANLLYFINYAEKKPLDIGKFPKIQRNCQLWLPK